MRITTDRRSAKRVLPVKNKEASVERLLLARKALLSTEWVQQTLLL
jgi:hypothetical protein